VKSEDAEALNILRCIRLPPTTNVITGIDMPPTTFATLLTITGTTRWLRAQPIPRDHWAIIKHLERGRKYDIQVVARGELGESSGEIDVIVAGSDPSE